MPLLRLRRIAISFDVVVRQADEASAPLYALPVAPAGGHSGACAPALIDAALIDATLIDAALLEAASAAQAGLLDADRRLGLALKRMLDIVLSMSLLLMLSPLLAVIYLAIRATSPGPAIFCQTRVGMDGTPFQIYKFRTMTVTENGACVVQAARSDARVTRFGSFLRRRSLDELPQFANVLKGDMSLIGPRPHAAAHDLDFANRVADYAIRRRVKPGITGWAQVNGARGGIDTVEDIQRRVALDLHYIQTWSLGLDLWILVRTALTLANSKNAY